MAIEWLPFLTFTIVTTFTPGPNNISSASLGLLAGYRRTLPYLLGITAGFFGLMLLAGLAAGTLVSVFPAFERVLRWAGSGYILWLAYETARASYTLEQDDAPLSVPGAGRGVLLQLLNPKAIFYGLTQYTVFLVSVTGHPLWLLLSALLLAAIAFSAVSTWTVAGASIRRWLQNPRWQRAVNIALSLLLVYTAADILGVFGGH